MQALRTLFIVIFLTGLLTAISNTSLAQTDAAVCTDLVKKAIQQLQTSCQNIGQDSVCYGHDSVDATLTDTNQTAAFHQAGDQVKINLLKTLHTNAADLASDKLGIAALNIGAYPADPAATSGTMALMLGDVSLDLAPHAPANQPNFTPAQTLYIHPPAGQPMCDDAQPLFVVRSQENTTVPLSINGSDVQLNGLITFHWESVNSLSVTAHRGSIEVVGGPKAQGGQTLVAVVDNDGTIMLWSDRRPATANEAKDLINFGNLSGSLAAFAGGCSQSTTHIVARGETLYRIATEYDTTVDAIAAANNIANTNMIVTGQSLVIPPCGQNNQVVNVVQPTKAPSAQVAPTAQPVVSSGSQATPPPVVASSGGKCTTVYVVSANDTLQKIASSYGGDIASILKENGISSIFAGQQLVIPC